MAEQPITLELLNSMSKAHLIDRAAELKVTIQKSFTKQRIVDAITGVSTQPPLTLPGTQPVSTSLEGEGLQKSVSAHASPQSPVKLNVATRENTVEDSHVTNEQMRFQLEMRKLALQERALEYEYQKEKENREHEYRLAQLQSSQGSALNTRNSTTGVDHFRVDMAAKMLPKWEVDVEIETYLLTFEKIASLNQWPKDHWSAIVQTHLKGKALKVFSELPTAECKDYEKLKKALFTAYELSPEVYRTRFRNLTKQTDTYSEFAFKLTNLFSRWLQGITSFDDIKALQQAMLMEQFMETIPIELKLWLTDQKHKNLADMARSADQYVALRKPVGVSIKTQSPQNDNVLTNFKEDNNARSSYIKPSNKWQHNKDDSTSWQRGLKPVITCAYCRKPNHTISECRTRIREESTGGKPVFSREQNNESRYKPKETCVIAPIASEVEMPVFPIHPHFAPFCIKASIFSVDNTVSEIRCLRDTAALQSLIRESSVPSSCYVHTGEVRLLRGVSGVPISVPLVELHLKTDFIDETVLCGLIQQLPEGVDFLLGNDIWFQANPMPDEVTVDMVVTRARTAEQKLRAVREDEPPTDPLNQSVESLSETEQQTTGQVHYGDLELTSVKSSLEFKVLQEQDKGISSLKAIAESEPFPVSHSYYYMSDGILFHHPVSTKKKLKRINWWFQPR